MNKKPAIISAVVHRTNIRLNTTLHLLHRLIISIFRDTSSIMAFAKRVNSEDTNGIIHSANNIDKECINLASLLRDVEFQMTNLTGIVHNMKVVLDEYQKQHKDSKLSVMALRALSGRSPYDDNDPPQTKTDIESFKPLEVCSCQLC